MKGGWAWKHAGSGQFRVYGGVKQFFFLLLLQLVSVSPSLSLSLFIHPTFCHTRAEFFVWKGEGKR